MQKTAVVIFLVVFAMIAVPVAAQEWAVEDIEESPRHHEWVDIKSADRTVRAWLVYPEVSHKAGAVVVIHENRGLTDWVRSMADQIAAAGYIAIAPDMLTGMAPDGGNTADFPSSDDARTAIYALDPEQVTADLKATVDYVQSLPAANGKVAMAGFCWGGSQCFRHATNSDVIEAFFVFYGTAPDSGFEKIQGPVFGFYGGNDARVNATIGETEKNMNAADKVYEPVIYEGAGHGFMRSGEQPDAAEVNTTGRENAWERFRELLEKFLSE